MAQNGTDIRIQEAEVNDFHLTLRDLKESIKKWEEMGVKDDTPVFIERVEDWYFEEGGWETVEYTFPVMPGPQKFFEAYTVDYFDGKILVHAHY